MLGVALCHQFRLAGFDVLGKDRGGFDARSLDMSQLVPEGCHFVVNACGMVNRRLSEPESDFLRVNSLFPRLLADVCARQQTKLIHISTDCVFNGDRGCYDERAQPDAQDIYGNSKHWGEPSNAMVIRTSIIGPELHNHYSLLCWYLRQQGTVRGFINHLWNGVTTIELAGALCKILSEALWRQDVFHLHGEDLSKFVLLELMDKAFRTNMHIEPVSDTHSRDTRLRSVHGQFLQSLAIAPMAVQLERVVAVSNRYGHWTAQ